MTTNQKRFLLILALFAIGNLVAITFTNFYLWEETNEFQLILLFNGVVFGAMGLGGIVGGIVAKKFGSIFTYQCSMILYALQMVVLVLLGIHIKDYIFFLGIISGLAIGLQSFSFTLITQQITTKENRESFFGTKTSLLNGALLLSVPVVAIIVQKLGTFMPLFFFTMIIFFLIGLLASTISFPESRGKFSLFTAVNRCKENPDLLSLYKAKYLYGIQDGLFWVVLGIITLQFVGNLTSWGILQSFFTLTSIVSVYIYSHTITLKNSNYTAVFATLLFAAITIVLATNWNLVSFILYQLVLVVLTVVMSVDYESFLDDILDEDREISHLRDEYNAFGEVVNNIGRLTPVTALLLLGVDKLDDLSLRTAFLVVAPIPLFIIHILSNTNFLKKTRNIL